jgi:hypothetical protein
MGRGGGDVQRPVYFVYEPKKRRVLVRTAHGRVVWPKLTSPYTIQFSSISFSRPSNLGVRVSIFYIIY